MGWPVSFRGGYLVVIFSCYFSVVFLQAITLRVVDRDLWLSDHLRKSFGYEKHSGKLTWLASKSPFSIAMRVMGGYLFLVF